MAKVDEMIVGLAELRDYLRALRMEGRTALLEDIIAMLDANKAYAETLRMVAADVECMEMPFIADPKRLLPIAAAEQIRRVAHRISPQ